MGFISINEENFDTNVRNSEVPVLVDFYASWCTPCRMMKSVLEELNDELMGEARVVKVDVMSESNLAKRFNIYKVPTMVIFRNGEVTDTLIGITGKEQLIDVLKNTKVSRTIG